MPHTRSYLPKVASVAGVGVGLLIGLLVLPVLSSPQPDSVDDLQVLHRQPALVLADEDVTLIYDVVCPWDEARFLRGGELCRVGGVVYVRPSGTNDYERFELTNVGTTPLLQVVLPAHLIRDGFVYYGEFRDEITGQKTRVPSGTDATHQAWTVGSSTPLHLAAPSRMADPDETVVWGRWGDAPGEFGVEVGNESATVGPAAFGFTPGGDLVVLDQINERLQVFHPDLEPLRVVQITHTRALADLEIGSGGTMYVLDGSASVAPYIAAYDSEGTQVAKSMLSPMVPESLREVDGILHVHDAGRSLWATVFHRSDPVKGEAQFGEATTGRSVAATDRESAFNLAGLASASDPLDTAELRLVVSATDDEVRLAVVDGPRVVAAWRVTSDRSFGEVQLAEIHDGHLIVVVRTWTSSADAFEVLRLAGPRLVQHLVVESADWAASAVLGRFELGAQGLYQQRTTDQSFSIVRFNLGGSK